MIINGYIFSFLYALVCIFLAFALSKLGLGKKYTRKFVHISVGFEWVILNRFFGPSIHFLIVCLAFTALLYLEYKLKLVPSLSSDGENAPGTVYYGVAMSIMAGITLILPKMILPFGIGVLVTSLGDGMAGVIGQAIRWKNPKIYGNKTLFGTLSTFLVSFIGILLFKVVYPMPLEIWQVLLISIFASSVELISTRGLDNIFLTLSSSALAYFLMYFDASLDYILPIMLTPVIIATVTKMRVLNTVGILLAVVLDLVVSVAFGNGGFVVLLSFLLISVVCDKLKRHFKGNADKNDDKTRGGRQVIANGAVGAFAALIFIITKNRIFTVIYLASVTEALADTVASGIGIFAKNTYDVFRFRKCEKGISGGMSLIGTASSLIASILISTFASLLGMADILSAILISFIAFSGMIFDSLLGSLLQVKYKCRICGHITERSVHCAESAEKYRGISFVDNNVVNIMANLFTAILAYVIFF